MLTYPRSDRARAHFRALGGANDITRPLEEARILEASRSPGRIGELDVAKCDPTWACEVRRPGAKDIPV